MEAVTKAQAALAGLRDSHQLERERAKLALDMVLRSAGENGRHTAIASAFTL